MADTTYIATQDIYAAPGVLAFTKGTVVPVSVVENLKAHDKVASDRTKAAAEAVKVATAPEAPAKA
jgi:hypothetical protein